jgi:hypothetical protein
MAVEMLKPTLRGQWEKALIGSSWWLIFIAVVAQGVVRDALGFWGSVVVTVAVMGLGTFLLDRLAAPERKERLARDAGRGLLQCALRYADAHPDSLRGRWLPGFAEVSAGTMRFPPDYLETGDPSGPVTLFTDVVVHGPVDLPSKRPNELKRNWKIVALGTDKGELHVATGDAGLMLIEKRLG